MKPMPLPRRRGKRIEDAGCAKTCEGRVMEGMKVVIFTGIECQRGVSLRSHGDFEFECVKVIEDRGSGG